jgi:hypothetical protein
MEVLQGKDGDRHEDKSFALTKYVDVDLFSRTAKFILDDTHVETRVIQGSPNDLIVPIGSTRQWTA